MNSLYIHIPFCERKCLYCSFVVSVGRERHVDLYLDCLKREAGAHKGMPVKTVYIGGGTPTLLNDRQLDGLFALIHAHFSFSNDAEWTIEANPEGLDDAKLRVIKNAGVNRISLGVQSLNDRYLKYLGRNHDARSARAAFERIKKNGFNNTNADLMFAFPRQTMDELKQDVTALARLGSEHLSLYTLTVEQNSRFFARNIRLQDNAVQARQYRFVCDALQKAGFEQYEVSNFAKPRKFSRHNMNYWQGGRYVGLGVGAHSYTGTKRSWNVSRFDQYVSNTQKGICVEEGFEELTPDDQMKEAVLLGLRMNRGIDVRQIRERFGCFLDEERQGTIKEFIDGGFLEKDNGCLKASRKGRLVLDELCARLV